MSDWYYADADRQRQGPLTAQELAQRFHQGKVRLDTLVWREGLPEWQPLRAFATELALHEAPTETFYTPVDRPAAAVDPATVSNAAGATGSGGRIEPVFARPDTDASPYSPPTAPLSVQGIVHAGEVVYAGFWKRLAAATIDGMIVGIAMLVVLGIGLAIFGGMAALRGFATGESSGAAIGLLLVGVYGVPIVAQAVYFTWMHASGSQATVGKMAVGIKVTRGDGTPISTSRSFGRWAGNFFFPLLTCNAALLASAIMSGVTDRKQALHDMASDTLVVDKWAFTAHPEWQRRELGAVTIAVLALLALLVLGYFAMIVFTIAMGAAQS